MNIGLERRLRMDLHPGIPLSQIRNEVIDGGSLEPHTGFIVGSVAAIIPGNHRTRWRKAIPAELRQDVDEIARARAGSIPLIVSQWSDIPVMTTRGRPGKLAPDSDFPGAYRATRSNIVIGSAMKVALGLAKGHSEGRMAADSISRMTQWALGEVIPESAPPNVCTLEQLGQILVPASRTIAATSLMEECRRIGLEYRDRQHVATARDFAEKELAAAREEMWAVAGNFKDPRLEIGGTSAADT